MTKKSPTFDFEKSLANLSGVVESLEKGDVPLENAIQLFEKGITISQECQKALGAAEQQVKILVKQQSSSTLEDFDTSSDDTDDDL